MNDPRSEFPPGPERRDALLSMRRRPAPEDFTSDEAEENERLADEFVNSMDGGVSQGEVHAAGG